MKTILVVDDNTFNLTLAEEALDGQYRVIAVSSAAIMFKMLEKVVPNLILLDVEMPDVDGFEVLKKLKSIPTFEDVPVIFLTSLSDADNEAYGIELGAVDFISKPFSKPVLLNRINNHLNVDEQIRLRTAQLTERTEQLTKRTEQLTNLKNGIVYALADIVESRDKNTGGHIDRTSLYIEILIDAMVEQGVYVDEMYGWDLESVISSARLHDVGKVTISDVVLNKPGKLTDEEFQIMKSHAAEGENIINRTIERTGDAEFLNSAKLFAAYHHERWDGSGYPYGLQGEEIPLHGRIMAIIDVYDALVSERPYKKPFAHEEAIDIIKKESGKHFDPRIANVFVSIEKQIFEANT